MVKKAISFLLLFFYWTCLYAADVQIEVEVNSDLVSENQNLVGKIIILHPDNQLVDEGSFTLEKKPLEVQLVSQGKQGSTLYINGKIKKESNMISCYCFELPGKVKGRYELPPLEVKIGDRIYHSRSIPYEIYETQTNSGFSLERFVEMPKKVYPGQTIIVGYRLALRTQIEITREYFPLFDPPGFHKVGDRKVRQYRRGNANIYEFYQELQADSSGNFEVAESFIEGLAFQEDFFSRRVYTKPKLKAKAEPITLGIQDFPYENKPDSFDGAIGRFKMEVDLISSSEICVGDKVELKITFRGEGLETLKLPQLAKQKSFVENFRFSDLPPVGKQIEKEKVFNIEIRPLKDSVVSIPSIEFSYFDPKVEEYRILQSDPISLNVHPLPSLKSEEQKEEIPSILETLSQKIQEKGGEAPLPLIEIAGVFPLSQEGYKPPISFPYKVEFFFSMIALFALQILIKEKLNKRKKGGRSSLYLLKEAFKYSKEPQKYHDLLEKALRMRFKEKQGLKKDSFEKPLSKEGISVEIDSFLEQLQEELFSGKNRFEYKISRKKAKDLYKKIGDLG